MKNEIPPAELEAVMRAHLRGLGAMEQYDYDKAGEAFREVHERAPGWIPGSINLAIALLNQSGSQDEAKKRGRGAEPAGSASASHFTEALELLDGVLHRDPNHLHAHFCRGIILEYQGQIADAHRDFRFVVDHDPSDGSAWYKLGSTLTDPDDPRSPAGPAQAKTLIEIYSKALDCNPNLVGALYKLQASYSWAGDRNKQKEILDRWRSLNPETSPTGSGDAGMSTYGGMGRYATIIDPIDAPKEAKRPGLPTKFAPPVELGVTLPDGHRWAKEADFQGPNAVIGRARARFGAAIAAFDANGDGRLDLFLASAVIGPKGVHDLLLLNKGDGRFEDATAAFGLPDDRGSLGAAAGDFDADRHVDLYLTGIGENRLYRNLGKRFEDITQAAGLAATPAVSLTARWMDLDQDGDLDLYVINYTSQEHANEAFTGAVPPGLANRAFRNDGKPAAVPGRPADNWAPVAVASDDLPKPAGLSIKFSPWPDGNALAGGDLPHTAVAALDVDDDRDIDLVLAADGAAPRAVLNDRLGKFHAVDLSVPSAEAKGSAGDSRISGLLVSDFDKDGLPDVAAVRGDGPVALWRNATSRASGKVNIEWKSWPTDARNWVSSQALDLDLDTWPDLLGLPARPDAPHLEWARNEGRRLSASPLAIGPEKSTDGRLVAFIAADAVGDPLPDLVFQREGSAPQVARNLGNSNHWLAIDLSGRWNSGKVYMRTNPQGLGVRLALEGQGLYAPYNHTTPDAGLAQSVGPIVLGLGDLPSAALLRLLWPDGTIQCELNVTADKTLGLAEHNRKTSSCPVLFAWNGERFVCIGDFLGGGGLGYLVAPGVYSQPDRDEAVAIAPDQLRAVRGIYRLTVVEPMDEVTYLDHLTLDVVDRAPGVSTTPDERFVPEGPRPTGQNLAWRTAVEPARASDLGGRDVTEKLRAWDRSTVDDFRKLGAWIGYAEEHGIVLDFGDRLSRFGPDDRLVLCLAGWVEYPYSQTNYAAATAGVALRPPSLERLRADGKWEVIEPHAGYPAGLPRMTTLDLTGKLAGPRCVIRLKTNMECYWDQAFVAVCDRTLAIRVTNLPVASAVLGDRGYLRESSPDGRLPLLYDYEFIDPAPLARMSGRLTRHGDVRRLLTADDDHLCLVGPGDEARLEFDGRNLPALPEGWSRSFVLRAVGYCKDADPFTAVSDTVEPLPWRGMPAFPFGPEGARPRDAVYDAYLREFQTRPAGEK